MIEYTKQNRCKTSDVFNDVLDLVTYFEKKK